MVVSTHLKEENKLISKPIDIQYLNLLRKIYETGFKEEDRTSVGSSLQSFGESLKFNTSGKYIPFIQHRSFGPKTSFLEWQWMIRGDTDANTLKNDGVHIWDAHTSREFLDSRGLHDLPTGSVGCFLGCLC